MKLLIVFLIIVILFVLIGLMWFSFKMLRETQKQAKLEQQDKSNDAHHG